MISHLHGNDTLPFYPMVEIPCHGIQGWALREETEEKTCPAVIFLHDGPQQAFGKVYHFGMQLLAQNGYVVLFANLPGSMGYGKDFSMLDGHWETMTATVLSVSWTLLWMPALRSIPAVWL